MRRAALATALLVALAAPAPAAAAPARVADELRAARAPAAELKQTEAVPLPAGATVYRFQQRVSGVPVLGGEAVVNDPPAALPALVADSTGPGVEAPPSPQVARRRAIGIASRSAGVRRLYGRPAASLAIEREVGGRLVWRVLMASARPLADYEVLVDAVSAEVLRTRNLLQFRIAQAKLYDPNPVVENGGVSGLRRDHHDRDTARLRSLRLPVLLPNIEGGQHCLRGRWAHAKLGREHKEVCRRGLDWRGATRSKDRFEALMAYYHIDRAQQYIQELGFSDATANGINDRSQVAIADALRSDNSFFSPFTRKIKYGTGGVDDAEDADVILHEYGHAMQDDQVPGFGTRFEAGSVGEGFGDYWAAAMSSLSLGTNNVDDVCIFDWDGVVWGAFVSSFDRYCGRRADSSKTLSQAKTGFCRFDVHCVGTVWSSALWDIRSEIGGTVMDQIVLASQFMYVPDERFDDAADALLCADEDLHPKGPLDDCQGENYPAIHKEMVDRDIL